MRQAPTLAPALTALLTAALAASCASNQGAREAEILDRMARTRAAQQAAYETERVSLATDFEVPYTLEFEGKGSIIVHRVELKGGPDRPLLHTQFTYVNTTGHAIPEPRISLLFHLPDGQEFEGSSIVLSRPIGVQFANGNAHTSWIDSPTGGLHLVPGWTWSLEVSLGSETRG